MGHSTQNDVSMNYALPLGKVQLETYRHRLMGESRFLLWAWGMEK